MPLPCITITPDSHSDSSPAKIPRELYGHFAEHLGRCIYEGIWVGEDSEIPQTRGLRNDVVAALKKLAIPVLRWPGGCFADEYHWRDGVGPREERRPMINNHWGGVVESNQFGTHEFMDLVETLGCDAYIAGNVGSGTVREMQEWVEYLTADVDSTLVRLRRAHGRDQPWRVRYFGVGNENWICGGNMRPEFYADEYRRYQTYVRHHNPDRPIYRIACGANEDDFNWTEVVMARAADYMDGLSLHFYTIPTDDWDDKGSAIGFDRSQWFAAFKRAARMDEILAKHSAIMDRHDPQQRVGLIVDEWGTWHNVEPGTHPRFLYQQNTLRDALVAAQTLHIFHRHRKRVRMANIAQTVNVLQAMILTDGPRMLCTPTYHIFEMFKVHQDATYLPLEMSALSEAKTGTDGLPRLDASASRDAAGNLNLTLINFDPDHAHEFTLALPNEPATAAQSLRGRILTADTCDAHNTFDAPDRVQPQDANPVPVTADGTAVIRLPGKCVALYTLH
ncbi:MAG: alpha-L-arabinofuranosidase AbfB [Synoicihabitans sp.]